MDIEKIINEIDALDIEILYKLKERKEFNTNTNLYKFVYEDATGITPQSILSELEKNLYDFEKQNKYLYRDNIVKPYFREFKDTANKETLSALNSSLNDINFNQHIKMNYINFLYDLCAYGINEDNNTKIVNIDIDILLLLSKRVHIGITLLKAKFLQNPDLYTKLTRETRDIYINYFLRDYSYESNYICKLLEKAKEITLDETLIYQYYKMFIIPMFIEVQYNYLTKLNL